MGLVPARTVTRHEGQVSSHVSRHRRGQRGLLLVRLELGYGLAVFADASLRMRNGQFVPRLARLELGDTGAELHDMGGAGQLAGVGRGRRLGGGAAGREAEHAGEVHDQAAAEIFAFGSESKWASSDSVTANVLAPDFTKSIFPAPASRYNSERDRPE